MLLMVTRLLLLVSLTCAVQKLDLLETSNLANEFFEDGAKRNERYYIRKEAVRSYDEPGRREAHLDNFLDRLTLTLGSKPTNNSTRCQWDIYRTEQGIINRKTWALNMIDSFGKPGGGIFEGHIRWPGSYSQCRSVKSQDDNAEHGSSFSGLYCWLNLKPVISDVLKGQMWELLTVRTGVCFPDSCSEDELSELIQKTGLLHYIEDYLTLKEISCIVPRPPIWEDPKAVIAFVFILLLALLLSVGTIYDLMTDHSDCCDRRIHHSRFSELGAAKKWDGNDGSCDSNGCYNKETTKHIDDSETHTCGTGSRSLLAFSVRRNGKNLFRMSDGKDSLPVLNGIRFFSLVWIILFHTWFFLLNGGIVDNMKTFAESYEDYFVQTIIDQTLGVDSFLVLRTFCVDSRFVFGMIIATHIPFYQYALLVTYNYFNKRQNIREKKSWARFYMDRYLRLTLTNVAVMIVFYGHLWLYVGGGPFWDVKYVGSEVCYKDWWKNLLYINNFFSERNACMVHTWYLALDMQFFFLSPLFLIALERYRYLAASLFAAFLAATWTTTLVFASIVKPDIHFHIKTFSQERYSDVFASVYARPYCRMGPYLIGMICGWFLHKTQRNVVMKKKWVFIGWVVAATCMLNVLFNTNHSLNYKIFFATFARSMWAVGVSWIIFACCNGYGGIVNKFLNIPLWNVMSRLTYCAYLVHYNLVYFFYGNSDVLYHFEGKTQMFYKFITNVICSYVLAAVVYLAVEAPLTITQKIIFPDRR